MKTNAKYLIPTFFLIIGIFAGYVIFDYLDEDASSTTNKEHSFVEQTTLNKSLQFTYPNFDVKFPHLYYTIHPDDLDKETECRKDYLDSYKSYLIRHQESFGSEELILKPTYAPCIDIQESSKRYEQYIEDRIDQMWDTD